MASNMKSKYDKYYGDINRMNIFLYVVIILNPQFKLYGMTWIRIGIHENTNRSYCIKG